MNSNKSSSKIEENQCDYSTWRDWKIRMIIRSARSTMKNKTLDEFKNLTSVISEVSNAGVITFKFSDTIMRPCFLKEEFKRRNLGETSFEDNPFDYLDIEREILNCKFNAKSDISFDSFKHTFELVKWFDDQIIIQIKFENPLMVSQGLEKDEISC